MMISQIKENFLVFKRTAVAGLKFFLDADNAIEKTFWSFIGILGISGMIYLINGLIETYSLNPIMASRKWVDLSEIDLPAITFCHQGNTRMEVAERLLQVADEDNEKVRTIRSIFLRYAVDYFVQMKSYTGKDSQRE